MTTRNLNDLEKLEVVKAFYEKLAQGDVAGVLGLLHPEVRWTEAKGFPYYSGTWVGPDAVLNNLLKRLAADWSVFSAESKEQLIEGPTIVSFGTYSGTNKKTGKSMQSDFAHVWTVDEGKITSFLMFADTAKVLEALQP